MRKIAAFLGLAVLLAAGCSKEKMVTKPCAFDIKIEWVKASKAQFTITPDNPDATYYYSVMAADDDVLGSWTDEELIFWHLKWTTDAHDGLAREGKDVYPFDHMFCYKGARTIKERYLTSGMDWYLLVFQVNPKTRESIGPLYKVPFSTPPIHRVDLSFTIHSQGNRFTIIPSDQEQTWFWEYETESKIVDVYDSPYFFFYNIIDMYEEYNFLDHLLCRGNEEWVLPRDDRSIKEGEKYTMSLSAISDGEICSDLYYVDFIYENGRVSFVYSDIPIVNME